MPFRRTLLATLSSVLVAFVARAQDAPESAPTSRPTTRFLILHTNDVHGQIRPIPDPRSRDGAPRMIGGYQELVAAIDEERASVAHSILVDAGDWWQGTPEGTLSQGRCSVELMNAAGYDLAVVGNHDFDAGPAALLDLVRLARFPVVGANVAGVADDPAAFALARHVRTGPSLFHVGDFVVAVGGVCTDETPRITSAAAMKGIRIAPNTFGASLVRDRVRLPSDRARGAALGPAQDDADALVLVNHESRERNLEIAKSVPDLDVVVGGHFHSDALREGVVAPSGTLIAQAGANTRALGIVTLEIDPVERRIVKKSARLRWIEARPELTVPRLLPIIDRYEADVARRMDVPVADVPVFFGRGSDLAKPGPLPAWLCAAMLARTGADVAIHNHGGIRADLPAGRARVREFFQISPFGNRLVSVDLKASDVIELARRMATNPGRGLVYAGVEIVARKNGDGPPEVIGLRRNGADLAPDAVLRVATTDFLALARDGATAFGRATNYRDHDETLLDATLAHARSQGTLAAPTAPVWVFVD